jgi:hypothetical protein
MRDLTVSDIDRLAESADAIEVTFEMDEEASARSTIGQPAGSGHISRAPRATLGSLTIFCRRLITAFSGRAARSTTMRTGAIICSGLPSTLRTIIFAVRASIHCRRRVTLIIPSRSLERKRPIARPRASTSAVRWRS